MTLPLEVKEEPQLEENLVLYKRRWLILIIYSLAAFLNATLLITFAPIAPKLVEFYGFSTGKIDFLSMLFIITFLPGILSAVYLSRGHGFATSFKVGALLQALGCAIRMFAYILPNPNPTYWYTMMIIGQVISGLAQPMLTSIAAQLANQWFAKNESIAAQFAGSLSNPLGIALGALYSRGVVDANDSVDRGLQIVLLSQALCAGVLLALGLYFFEENPPTPPSTAAVQQWQDRQDKVAKKNHMRQRSQAIDGTVDATVNNALPVPLPQDDQNDPNQVNFSPTSVFDLTEDEFDDIGVWDHFKETMGPAFKDFKTLMKSKDFLTLAIPFGLGMTIFNSLVSLPNAVIGPFSEVDAAKMTAVIICVGLVSCIIWSIVLEVTKQFRLCLKLGFVIASAAIVFFFSQLHKEITTSYLYVLFACLGFFIIPLLPLTIENAQESTHPMPAQIVSAILLSFGQLPSVPVLFLFMSLLKQDDYINGDNPLRSGFGVMVTSLLCIAIILVMFYSGESNRQKALNLGDGDYAEIPDDNNDESNYDDTVFMDIRIGDLFGGSKKKTETTKNNTSNEKTGLLDGTDDDIKQDRIVHFTEPSEGDIDADIDLI